MHRSPDNFASIPMIIPLIILLELGESRSLQLVYLLPVIWTSLLVSSYLIVWLLKNSIRSRTAVFLAFYMAEGAVATLVSTLAYLPSLPEKQALGIIILTVSIFVASYAIVRYSKTKAGKTVPSGTYSAELTERMQTVLGGDDKGIPSVYLSGFTDNRGKKIATVRKEKKIFLLDSLAKTLTRDESDALLAYSFFKYSHSEETRVVYLIATVFAFEADVFAYILMGGFPGPGIIILPIVGVLLLVEIIFSPIIIGFAALSQNGRSDRYAAKVTGNPGAVASMIYKVEGWDTPIPQLLGRSGRMVSWLLQRHRNRRLSYLAGKQ
jgi:Zn-dependent protease with chaperone function